MGIPGLWDILGDGDTTSLAHLATCHFLKTGRPLRIAVDEAGWRFHNLTPFQVLKIREAEPAANPIEKAIFFRLVKLLRLNLQLLFVSDGPRRPWKRNKRGGGRLNYEETKLLNQLLDVLKVPRHRAPAEAEAECARLQQEGIVDAVWSDDGDTLMFGCGVLLRELRVDNKKSETHVRVYRAEAVQQKLGLDRDALVAFAMLSGGDYNTKGLPGCGPTLALQAARAELGRSLCQVRQERDLRAWREELASFLATKGKRLEIPPDFPGLLHLQHYANPVVSTVQQLHDLRGLRRGWDLEIDQAKLRVFARERFNIWTRGYVKHIVPALLAKKLSRDTPQDLERNANFGIRLVQSRKRKRACGVAETSPAEDHKLGDLERKISYLPLQVVDIDLSIQPNGEDWSVFKTKDGTAYDPKERVETEILECVLRPGLSKEVFDEMVVAAVVVPEKSASRRHKRGAIGEENHDGGLVAKQKRPRESSSKKNADDVVSTEIMPPTDFPLTSAPLPSPRKSREEVAFLTWREEENQKFQQGQVPCTVQDSDLDRSPVSTPTPPQFVMPPVLRQSSRSSLSTVPALSSRSSPIILDLSSDSEDEEEEDAVESMTSASSLEITQAIPRDVDVFATSELYRGGQHGKPAFPGNVSSRGGECDREGTRVKAVAHRSGAPPTGQGHAVDVIDLT